MPISLCPHQEPFRVGEQEFSADEIIACLGPVLLEQRRDRLAQVVAERTYSIVPVTEGLYDHGNVNAVIRSTEALGYQGFHNIDSSEKFKQAKRVSQGADKWLDMQVWPDTGSCVQHLKSHGYRILATHFEEAESIDSFDFTIPTAIVFGNERDGVSAEMLAEADARMIIPMAGFSRSFNISVAAALCLYHIRQDRIHRMGRHGDLDEHSQKRLLASYYLRSAPAAEKILLGPR
jgi:tRNA (guanosine-2'-O-)-methyltransferase